MVKISSVSGFSPGSLKKRPFPVFMWVALLSILPVRVLAQETEDFRLPLFEDTSLIKATLVTEMKPLMKDRGEERNYHPGIFYIHDQQGDSQAFEVKVMVRGNFRRQRSNCEFPPLRVKFEKDKTKGTLFAHNGKLKLVTHCRPITAFEQNLVQEYLCYRLYNLVEEFSFRVRMFHLTYRDNQGREQDLEHLGFFIEDDDDLARRQGGIIIKAENAHPLNLDPEAEIRLALFCYMIGNTDWSIPELHNIRLVATTPGAPPVAVPYDFDWSGLVNANYAKPDPILPIESVQERLYRGFCQDEELFQKVRKDFLDRKDQMFAEVQQCPWLTEDDRKETLEYLAGFFETIFDDKQFKREILKACRTDR